MMESLSVVKTPVPGYWMNLSLHSSLRIGPLRRLDTLIVYAKKDRRSSDGFSWKRKRPKKKYSPRYDNLGDISILYRDDAVVESSDQLLKDCTKHISDHVEEGNLLEAEKVFNLMIKKRVEPNAYTFTALMKGYSEVGNTERVSELFKEMEEKGVEPTEVTFNTAIRSYTNNGDLAGAQSLFRKMKDCYGLEPNVYTYGSMLNVCVSAKDLDLARSLLDEMDTSNVKQNKVTLTTMIDVYAECCNKENGKRYFEECTVLIFKMKRKGIKANEQTYNTLLKLCSRGNLFPDAMRILNKMVKIGLRPNVVSYSTVLNGISKGQSLSSKEVLALSSRLVDQMRRHRILPDAFNFSSLLNVCLRVGDLYRADRLFKEMKTLKIEPTLVTYGTMIKCYEKLGDPSQGDVYLKPCLELLEECEEAGIKMEAEGYASLLSACAKASNIDQALRIWTRMISDKIKQTAFAYSAMINVCVSAGSFNKALSFFKGMKTAGITPNSVTYGTMIKCYEKLGDSTDGYACLESCLGLWHECEQAGMNLTIEGYTSLLSACAKAADLDQASNVWDKMIVDKIKPDVVVYTAMINVCLSKDNEDMAFDFFDEMKTSGIKPNVVTFGTFMSYFEKNKDRAGAEKIHAAMKIQGVQPDKAILRMLRALGIE